MFKRVRSLIGVVGALLVAGCAQAPPPAAPDMREADMAAIHNLELDWVKAFEVRDAEKVASFLAEDASVLMTGMPILNGRESAKEAFVNVFKDPNFLLTFDAVRTEVSQASDYAYSQGTYTMAMTDPMNMKNVATEKGKFVTVYKKQADGMWKVVADASNADGPATTAPPTLIAPRP